MRNRAAAVLLVVLASLSARAQEPTRRELRPTKLIPLPGQRGSPIGGPLKCSPKGDLYFRSTENDSDVLKNPVVRVSSDGEEIIRFTLAGAPGLVNGNIIDYAPGFHGEIYLLVADEKWTSYYVVSERVSHR